MNPFVFLVGCPRSGTTLLGRLANAHPSLAIIHESRWITDVVGSGHGLTTEGRVTTELADLLTTPKRLKPMGLTAAEVRAMVADHTNEPVKDLITALFEEFGRRRDRRLVGDKTPGYVRYLPLLHGLWPRARFAHIIRDGRSVWLSVREWGKGASAFHAFRDDPVTTAGVWWTWYVSLGREGTDAVGAGRVLELRYEALVSDPETACRKLCAFLGLPYDAAMLRFHEGRTNPRPGLSTKSAWLPVTPGLRDWRDRMDHDDLERFESAAGDLLEELGYPRATSPSTAALDRAARVRERFTEQLLVRGRPVPPGWRAANGIA